MNRKGQVGLLFKRGTWIVLLSVVFVIVAFSLFSGVNQSFFSVDEVTVLGEGDRVLITGSLGPGTEDIIVDLSNSQLNQELSGQGWAVDRGVRISLNLESFARRYPLRSLDSQIFNQIEGRDTGNVFVTIFTTKQDLIEECQTDRNLPQTIDAATARIGQVSNLICYLPSAYGKKGDFTGNAYDEFVIKIGANNDVEFINVNTENERLQQKVAILDGGNIEVSFEGSLNAPTRLSTNPPFDIFNRNGAFLYLIDEGNGFTQSGHSRTEMTSCTRNLRIDDTAGHDRCKNDYNQRMFDSIRDKTDQFAPEVVENIRFSGNEMRVEVRENSVPQYPVVRIIVDGAFLGIDRLEGEPEITSCAEDIESVNGREERGTVSVKNSGSERGSFEFIGRCDNSNIRLLGSDVLSIEPGATENVNLFVTGEASQQNTIESGECTITFRDRTSRQEDSCNFGVEYEFSNTICEPGTRTCSEDGSTIKVCNGFGDGFEEIQCTGETECGLDVETNRVECIDTGFNLGGGGEGSNGGSGSRSDPFIEERRDCEELAEANPFLGYAFIVDEPNIFEEIFTFGRAEPDTSCKATYVPLYIGGGVLLILGLIIFFLMRGGRRNGRRK